MIYLGVGVFWILLGLVADQSLTVLVRRCTLFFSRLFDKGFENMPIRTWRIDTRHGPRWRAVFAGASAVAAGRLDASRALENQIRERLEAPPPVPEPPEVFHATGDLLGLIYWTPAGWYAATYRRGSPTRSELGTLCETKLKAKDMLLSSLAWETRNLREDRGEGLFDLSTREALLRHRALLKQEALENPR